jgi:Tol biopolymer transport system component
VSPRRSLGAALCLLALTLSATGAQAARDEVDLVSRAGGAGGAKGNSSSNVPVLSGDGRLVAFDSFATNLHADDLDRTSDVFVRDLQTNATTLVSRASGATGAKGNSYSLAAAMSADGRYVAFESLATNLHPSDGDAVRDVFVRDLQTNTTTLVSRATGATGAKGDGMSLRATISGNGRFVAFESTASNLDPADTDTGQDVFVRDLATNTTTLVSRASGVSGAKGNGGSSRPAVTDDGFVVFQSLATNLSPSDGDAIMDVFARDLGSATTTLVSRASNGVKGNSGSFSPAVSGDGRFVAF